MNDRRRRVLFVGYKNDYGDPARGPSFEYVNFFQTLATMQNIDARLFAFDEVLRLRGRAGMNQALLRVVEETQPDLCFFTLFTDEISRQTLRQISRDGGTITLNWFGDDHWRFEGFSRYWAPLFDWCVTTDSHSVEKYLSIGCSHIVRSQWGFNPVDPHPHTGRVAHLVTFVGQVHSTRRRAIETLHARGVNVECWGRGWDRGRLPQEDMPMMFAASKVNLNFAQSSPSWGWKSIAKAFVSRRLDGSFRLNAPGAINAGLVALLGESRSQIKGRNFEIPGAGGFLLTEYVDGLEEYFVLGKEIATFHTLDDLVEQVSYYLSHEVEREAIRDAGFQRAMKDHTFERRLHELFQVIGLT